MCTISIVQEDLPGVENAIFQSVIQESLHDIGGEKRTSYEPEHKGGGGMYVYTCA